MKNYLCRSVCGMVTVSLCLGLLEGRSAMAQHPNAVSAISPQEVLKRAAAEERYTFIVFYRDQNMATQQMIRVVREGAEKNGSVSLAYVPVTDPSMQDLISRFDVARAPMPLTMVVSHNGAITGVFPRRLATAQLANAILPPKMTQCMRSLQENRLVFVFLRSSAAEQPLPSFVTTMQADPEFGERLDVIEMNANETAETALLQDMGIAAESMVDDQAVLLAPPGVVVGKFDRRATYEQVTSALHQSGKCCDDPHCKHNRSASQPSRGVRQ